MLKAKNWESFQSYKDRNPPWIRLHKRLLDDFSFQKMSVGARALLPMIWLLISEDEDPVTGLLRIGYEEISFRLRMPIQDVKTTIEEIIRAGFLERIEPDEKDLFGEKIQTKSECYGIVTKASRNRHPETETETETETEKKKYKKEIEKPDDVSFQVWNDFKTHRNAKKAPITQTGINRTRAEAEKIGWSLEQALIETCSQGWQGFRAEYIQNKQKGNINGSLTKSQRADAALERASQKIIGGKGFTSQNFAITNQAKP